MKHAGRETLAKIEPLLARLRGMAELKEKTPGTFYFKSRAFLHFHEDPAGLYADIRAEDGAGFDRIQVDDADSQAHLMERARRLAGK